MERTSSGDGARALRRDSSRMSPPRPQIVAPAGSGSESAPVQPRQGAVGLVVVAVVVAVLLFSWGGAGATLHVLGIVSTYALPGAVVVALWWEDWPGTHFRARWSGLVDTVLVAVGGVVAALVGQAVVQHLDVVALFEGAPDPARSAAFPALLPLGAAVFTVMLQLTLVTEGWPFRRLGRFGGGAAALAASWTVGLLAERALVGSGVLNGAVFAAGLSCIAAFQVLGWVVLRGRPVAGIRSRPLRLLTGNAVTIGGALVAYAVLRVVVGDGVPVGGAAASVVGAGLVTGMLFQDWPAGSLDTVRAQLARVVATVLLAGIGLVVCSAVAPSIGLRAEDVAGWSSYALNTVATAVIVHVGICRRWPMRERPVRS